jgi:hypothetical protein
MGITQALQYSSDPTNILLKQAEQARADQKLKEAAALQDEKMRYALPMQLIGVMQNADTDVAQHYSKEYVDQLSAMVKNKEIPFQDIQLKAAEYAADINQRSGAVKSFRKNAYDTIEKLSTQFGAKPENLVAITNKYILDNLNNPANLQNGSSYITSVIQKEPSLYVDNTMGTNLAMDLIKRAPLSKLRTETTTDPNGVTSKTIKSDMAIPPWFQASLDKNGNPTVQLKVDKNGVISDDVFHMFYNYQQKPNDFRMRSWLDAQANHYIDQNNINKLPTDAGYIDPNDDGAKVIAAKQYLGNFLREYTKTDISSINRENTTLPRSTSGAGSAGGFYDYYQVLSDAMAGKSGPVTVNNLPVEISTGIVKLMAANKYTKMNPDRSVAPLSASDIQIVQDGDKYNVYYTDPKLGKSALVQLDKNINNLLNVGKAKTASQKANTAPQSAPVPKAAPKTPAPIS